MPMLIDTAELAGIAAEGGLYGASRPLRAVCPVLTISSRVCL